MWMGLGWDGVGMGMDGTRAQPSGAARRAAVGALCTLGGGAGVSALGGLPRRVKGGELELLMGMGGEGGAAPPALSTPAVPGRYCHAKAPSAVSHCPPAIYGARPCMERRR